MPMRDDQKRADRLERQPGLFLERTPSTSPHSDDVDEMVPEFMQRGFYRSQEGELEAVEIEPSGVMRAVRSHEGVFRAAPLRGSHKPPAARSSDEYEPVRSEPRHVAEPETQEPMGDAVVVDTAPSKEPVSQAPRSTGWPRPVETTGLNLPLLLCLFFVVGLFLWREQTRPVVAEQQELPIPRRVREAAGTTDSRTELTDQPQSVTTPSIAGVPQEQALPLEQAPVASQSDDRGDSLDPDTAIDGLEQDPTSLFPADSAERPASGTVEHHDTAAQRAAILDRMSAGTVNRNDRERRMENDLQDGSLFPITQPEPAARKPVPSAEPAARKPAAVRSAAPPISTASKEPALFPETEPMAQPVVDLPPSAPSTGGGKPKYQIAEPEL